MNQLTIITLDTKEPIDDFAKARNEKLDKTKTEWVLFLDSDEELSRGLKEEIRQVTDKNYNNYPFKGYYFRRKDRFLGKWLRFGETGNTKIIRLARKNSGQWERLVHETWKIKGKVGELKNPIYHYHNSVEEMIERIDKYSSIEAKWRSDVIPRLNRGIYKNNLNRFRIKSGMTSRAVVFTELVFFPLGKFVWNYFVKLGFLDGMEGFILAGLMSFHSFLVRAKQIGRINLHPEERAANDEGSSVSDEDICLYRSAAAELDSSSQLLRMTGILFLIGWMSGELLRWNGMIPVTLMDVAMVLLIIKILATKGYSFRAGKLEKLGVVGGVFMASWLLGLRLFSIGESIAGLLYLFRISGYLLVILHAGELFFPVKKYIYLALITFVILGLGQYIFLPDTRFLLQYGWDEHYYRLIGTILDPNYMGAMAGVIVLFAMAKKRWVLLAMAFLTLVLTYSRASWLAVGIGSVYYWFTSGENRRKLGKLGLLGGLGFLIIYLVAPRPGGEGVNIFRTFSIEQRIGSWKEGIVIWRKHPWLGVGFNNYAVTSGKTDHASNSPSNSWILGLDTLGIWGVLVIWGVLGRKIKNVTPVWNGIAVLLSIHAIFNNTLFYTPILGLVALIKAANEE